METQTFYFMKNIILAALFTGLLHSSFAQANNTDNNLSNLIKLDLALQGIGFTFEPRIYKKMTIDFSAGAGGGYDVSEDRLGYEYNFLQPAFYFSVTPKYFYNIQKRIDKGKSIQFNSGNYIGLRLKYNTASIAANIYLRDALLINLHWGLQRAIGNKWTYTTHIGAGYAKDINSQFGTIYPALDFKFSYILSKSKK